MSVALDSSTIRITSATVTGNPVCSAINLSIPRNSEEPPASTMPRRSR
jgi:hypothetical protein